MALLADQEMVIDLSQCENSPAALAFKEAQRRALEIENRPQALDASRGDAAYGVRACVELR